MNSIDKSTIEKWTALLANGVNKPENEISVDMKNEFNQYNKTWKILEEMQEIEQFDTDKAWNKLYSKIGEDDKGIQTEKVRTLNFRQVFAIAATVVILIGMGSYLLYNAALQTISIGNDSLSAKLVNLPDGSQIYLNADSEISYNKTFGIKDRSVNLNGEAFFEVAKDKSKPFIVHTNNTYVKVVGTSFNINASSLAVEVVVKTGKVEVYSETDNSEHVMLLPGDQAIVSNTNEISKKQNINENYISWIDQKLIFKALPLSIVVNDIMKTYHCNIELSDTSLNNLKITTTFDNDSLEDVLESISLALNLHVEKEGKRFILVSN